MPNALDPSVLVSLLPTVLPASKKLLNSPQDGLTALVHSIMSALSFRLVAIDDASPSRTIENNVLPEAWNKSGPGSYTLRYLHDQSSLQFLLKISKLGARTLVNAIAIETDKTSTLDIASNDFLSQSFYPHDIGAEEAAPLVHGFISSTRVADFVSQYKLKILQQLMPGLRKEGYTEELQDSSSNSSSIQRPDPDPQPQPVRPAPYPEGPFQPPRHPSHIPSGNPLEIGRRDLDPFGFDNPFNPPPLFPTSGGDGMFVGPDHPIFGNRRPNRSGPWGGDGFLPPMGAPPGARFDPVGPWPPGRRPNPRAPGFGGPDNDEFMPPHGSDDMFS
ncbi:hypothetical protein BD410DRAFT_736820 [Rickenella mellea]|uniref:Uncharacterized protein n=1 Tax=Rickenella mellea TaxID=50990 RepID=A0A4R5XH06_9AGAM|nr:hypothetical protein BD410DRAFT_736820 [Rickenella mellea]